MTLAVNTIWKTACSIDDLAKNAGVAVLIEGQPIALFYLPEHSPSLFAIDHYDPLCNANVIARGIVGSIGENLCVASPLYKQHFSLLTGECLEQPNVQLKVWPCQFSGNEVKIAIG
jgi:nitrite reductase (NADH) small subunit